MLTIRDISIKNKLVLMQVFTSVLVLGLCFAAFILTNINGYKVRKVKSMTSLANLIGSNSISAIEFFDNETGQVILSDLKKISPEVIHAAITDKKGNIFATYSKFGADTFSFSSNLNAKQNYRLSRHDLIVKNEIVNNKEIIGTVYLHSDLSELNEMLNKHYQIIVVLLVVGVGLAFLIAMVIQPYISKRLLDLVKIMSQVSQTGDYRSHVVVQGKDEITALSVVFNNLMDQIQKSHSKKDEFIAIASHELKTPLTSIKAYVQLLSKIENKEPNIQFVRKTLENINKLQLLLSHLLDVTTIESGHLRLHINEFDIDTLIDETIASCQMTAGKHIIIRKGIQINSMIHADRLRIEQVLVNLISNATKYAPDTKNIIIETSKKEHEILISVRDFGIGIPREEQSRVFERFYRTKHSSSHISGFGLGLFICQDIIKRHNGRIWMESEGLGCCFSFTIPLKNSFVMELPKVSI